MANESIERVFSSRYSTVTQFNEWEKTPNKVEFCLNYLDLFKLHALFFGKVILTDSLYFDSLFIRNMGENTLKEFIDFAEKTNTLEIRIRKNYVVNTFSRGFWFSSITDCRLRDVLLNAGREIEKNNNIKESLKNDSVSTLIGVYETLCPDINQMSSFVLFKDNFILLDKIRNEKKSLFKLWGEDLPNLQYSPRYKGISDALDDNKVRCDLIKMAEPLLSIGKFERLKSELAQSVPKMSVLKELLDENEDQKRVFDFFHNIYFLGLGCQHYATIVETSNDAIVSTDAEFPKNSFSFICEKKEIEFILQLGWGELTELFLDNDISKKRDAIWNSVRRNRQEDFIECVDVFKRSIQQNRATLENNFVNNCDTIGHNTFTNSCMYRFNSNDTNKNLIVTYNFE